MKQDSRKFGQYIFENHNYDGSVEDFFKETALAIGSIVHTFNSLDALLNSAICELINDRTDEPGAIVIYKQTFSNKIDLFYRLIRSMEIAYEGEIPSFKKLIEDLKKCATLRNAVIHAEWDSMDSNGYTYVKMHFDKDGIRQHYWQFTPEALDEIDGFIHDTYMFFDTFENDKQNLLKS
jgi:hypothetical protein